MPAGLIIPSLLLAYGPAVALFGLVVAPYPYMLAAFFASGFAEAVSFILAGLVWVIVSTFGKEVTFILSWLGYVIIAESIRAWFYTLFIRVKRNFMVFGANAAVYPINDLHFAIASGIGWGLAESILFFVNVIIASASEGVLYAKPPCHRTGIPTVIGTSVTSLSTFLCNIAFSVMALCTYKYCRTGKGMLLTSAIRYISHLIMLIFPVVGVYSESCHSPLFIPPIMVIFSSSVAVIMYLKSSSTKPAGYVEVPSDDHDEDQDED